MQQHHNGNAGGTAQGEKATNRVPRAPIVRQTEILLWFPNRKSEAEKWILGSTRCNKGNADHTEGKEICLQPVKRWRVAYREADRG